MLLKNIKFSIASIFLLISFYGNSQEHKFSLNDTSANDNVVMTWNKTTPEQEMKDDVKALSEKGITIKYSEIKRNTKNEIIAIKVEYSDRKGNKGKLELNNQNAINTIKFFKQDNEIGFGEPLNYNGMLEDSSFINGFSNGNDILKQFDFGSEDHSGQSYSFSFPNDANSSQSNTKIIIQKDGKKPLVIENGEVIQGAADYTKDEIEEIKKNNQIYNNSNSFDFRNQKGLENFKKQMEKMKISIDKDSNDSKLDIKSEKSEMIKAKEEMIKAREELEKAKFDLEKYKNKLGAKTQKA